MVIGMTMATAGVLIAGLTNVGSVFLLGVAGFSFGEMLTGPKKSEYLGLISPPGKKGLYLGYVNIPVGIGGFIGAKLQGYVYGNFGEKAVLAQKYLAEHTDFLKGAAWSGRHLVAGHRDGRDAHRRLREDAGGHRTRRRGGHGYVVEHLQPRAPTFGFPFAYIGVAAIIALVVFARMARRWKDMDA